MKKQICIVLSLLLLFTACIIPVGAADAGLILASDGATDYRIVVGADASPAEQTAANTLADYLEQICGARFDLVTDNASPAAKEIVVGRTNRDADIAIDRGKMDEDAVRIVTNGDKLYLTGGTVRGALYAVYTFLEDWLGCRWFTHELTVVPEAETIEIPAIDYFYEPCFKQRTTYWSFSTIYADYCAAHKLHGVMAGLPKSSAAAATICRSAPSTRCSSSFPLLFLRRTPSISAATKTASTRSIASPACTTPTFSRWPSLGRRIISRSTTRS